MIDVARGHQDHTWQSPNEYAYQIPLIIHIHKSLKSSFKAPCCFSTNDMITESILFIIHSIGVLAPQYL